MYWIPLSPTSKHCNDPWVGVVVKDVVTLVVGDVVAVVVELVVAVVVALNVAVVVGDVLVGVVVGEVVAVVEGVVVGVEKLHSFRDPSTVESNAAFRIRTVSLQLIVLDWPRCTSPPITQSKSTSAAETCTFEARSRALYLASSILKLASVISQSPDAAVGDVELILSTPCENELKLAVSHVSAG